MRVEGDPVLGDRIKDIGSAVACPICEGGHAMNWGISLREDPMGFGPQVLEDFFHHLQKKPIYLF
jgi:hypothetical protein